MDFLRKIFYMGVNVINGSFGKYDGKFQNPSVRYGRNAASNMEEYINRLSVDTISGANIVPYTVDYTDDDAFVRAIEGFGSKLDSSGGDSFEYRYTKANDGRIDKISLLAASYEEMGQRAKASVGEMNDRLNRAHKTNVFNFGVVDTNENGLIEVDEYGTFLALADIKSKDKNSLDPKIMTGVITPKGTDEAVRYLAVNHQNKGKRAELINYIRNNIFKKLQDNLGLTKTLGTHNETSGALDILT